MAANVPMMDMGSARLGIIVADKFRRKMKMTITTRNTVSISVCSTSATDLRMDCERSKRMSMWTAAGIWLAELRQQLFDVVHDLDRVRAGLALDGEHDGAGVVIPARHLVVLHAVGHVAQFLQTHRIAVAIRDNHRAERPPRC